MLMIYLSLLLGLLIFSSSSKHLLVTLLSLEFLILLLFSLLMYSNHMSMMNAFTFLSITVCEGALGLSVLVSLVRSSGSDQVQFLNE
uniref:NADH-ubiquinone oxidoreductase chain 4L n=1 Tax=Artemia tibetiana TaxID=351233 RepID=M9NUM8_9CRUS|nr:NADH dehydrogenase subunit 4L [Artemia tibetiana]YP_010735567.1 NADH dehydrogenase subunit 4L [Artemia sorgeloosi]AFP72839.1 NADH dehydrogenase subunit 4L [Artemia tibetiana]AFP72852.1 NADH dehydrogenase subunit 4L [Artemia tibetiana]UZP16829.1 NADH dehydrogenase subunit 4L [Artemia tibetiana]UZP16842.1 NADH dehydrogenase subunit 4L [Artemia tibetiana]UZP16855.1 NADH dehydrogenase subunit 4L [Artemia tibetiana]